MVRGRKPKSTALHELEGTFRPKHHAKRKPVNVKGSLASPPDWMSDRQKQCWRDAVEYAPADVLARVDASALTTFALAEARLIEAAIAQNLYAQKCFETGNDPLIWTTNTGAIIQSPYLGIINRATDKLLKTCSELGFTPVSRIRLSAAMGDALDTPAATSSADSQAGGNFDKVVSLRPK